MLEKNYFFLTILLSVIVPFYLFPFQIKIGKKILLKLKTFLFLFSGISNKLKLNILDLNHYSNISFSKCSCKEQNIPHRFSSILALFLSNFDSN